MDTLSALCIALACVTLICIKAMDTFMKVKLAALKLVEIEGLNRGAEASKAAIAMFLAAGGRPVSPARQREADILKPVFGGKSTPSDIQPDPAA